MNTASLAQPPLHQALAPARRTSGFFRDAARAGLAAALFVVATAVVPAQVLTEQSPINITGAATVYNAALPALNFTYGTTTLDVVNTGSPGEEATIRANVPGAAGSVTVSGVTYDLLQFHFHTEAEHLINGARGPMELHMVHRDGLNNLLVVGRIIEESLTDNPTLAPIFLSLPPDTATHLTVPSFNLADLLPSTLTSFRYPGSLTTAPYSEGVKWVVLSEHIEMSHAQIVALEDLFNGPEGNSRAAQNLNGRVIQTDVVGFSTVPEPAPMALTVALGLGGMVAGRRFRAVRSVTVG